MAPAPRIAQYLRPGEEEWLEVLEKLNERFPNFGPERVAAILRENEGHAGQAAGVLRDLSAEGMRPVDPDDAEHVRTLLSSPAMFEHACKEHFKKFDINSDGALEWSEIVALVNSMYDNFGLQPPREGGLRAFFEANDTNGDGVLSEREFRRFFECFLRYAFFDVHNHEQTSQGNAPQQAMSPVVQREPSSKEPRPSPQRESRRHRDEEQHTPQRAEPSPQKEKKEPRESRRQKSPPKSEPKFFQCVAPNGCSYRRSADYQDRGSSGVPNGEAVQALEVWIRTPNGWLPLSLPSGELLFEPCDAPRAAERSAGDPSESSRTPKHRSEEMRSSKRSSRQEEDGEGRRRKDRDRSAPAMEPVAEPSQAWGNPAAPAEDGEGRRRKDKGRSSTAKIEPAAQPQEDAGLLPHEEEWRGLFERLQERFPTARPGQIAEALRMTGGHAGQAATKIRAVI